jgi:hypothetical protein
MQYFTFKLGNVLNNLGFINLYGNKLCLRSESLNNLSFPVGENLITVFKESRVMLL